MRVGEVPLFVLFCIALFLMGLMTGMAIQREAWESRIVDNPAQIAVIRSRVLLERSIQDLRKKEWE